MQFRDNRIEVSIHKIGNLFPGDCFMYTTLQALNSKKLYMITDLQITPNTRVCIDLENGSTDHYFNIDTEVELVNVEANIFSLERKLW